MGDIQPGAMQVRNHPIVNDRIVNDPIVNESRVNEPRVESPVVRPVRDRRQVKRYCHIPNWALTDHFYWRGQCI